MVNKDFMLKLFNSREFKKWLISKRWFGNKLHLHDLKFNVQIKYYEKLSENIILLIITILTNDYSKYYFFPIVTFTDLRDILDPSENNNKKIQNINDYKFEGEIKLLEAEYCLLFWKKVLGNLDINDAFKDPHNYVFSLHQLGKDNTTNLIFSLDIKNKDFLEKPLITYVLKSYKNYAENLEIIKLRILDENGFKNIPKVFGTIDIQDINVIGIMEIIPNIGNIGDIYWNELNNMMDKIYTQEKPEDSLLLKKNECINTINEYCTESIKISTQIGKVIDLFLKGLIKPESVDYSVIYIDFLDYFNDYSYKLKLTSSRILESLNKLEYSTNSYQWDMSELRININKVQKVIQELKQKFEEKKIRIQPIHQDLHMEQILYNKKNGKYDLFFLDLEGDPQLLIEERKRKYPIEKDIANFLRSLSYIKFNTLLNHLKKKGRKKIQLLSSQTDINLKTIQATLNTWEQYIKNKILENIRVNQTLIHLFTIERILSEMNYEILYRPENILIPILGLQEFMEQDYS